MSSQDSVLKIKIQLKFGCYCLNGGPIIVNIAILCEKLLATRAKTPNPLGVAGADLSELLEPTTSGLITIYQRYLFGSEWRLYDRTYRAIKLRSLFAHRSSVHQHSLWDYFKIFLIGGLRRYSCRGGLKPLTTYVVLISKIFSFESVFSA